MVDAFSVSPLHYDREDEEKPLNFFDFRNNKLMNKLLEFFDFRNNKLVNKPLKFFNFRNNKLVNMKIPNTEGRKYWGCPFDWILTLELCGLNVYILNPLSQIQLSLPSLHSIKYNIWVTRFCSDFVRKLVLSSYPSDSSVEVMAIYGEEGHPRLVFAKSGDEIWTSISSPENWTTYTDAIFFKGHFFVVTNRGKLMICDTKSTNSPIATYFSSPPEHFNLEHCKFHLVEMHGDLFMIKRDYVIVPECGGMVSHRETIKFVTHKLDLHSKTWIYSQTLGDYVLFLGNNTSFAISTNEYPNFKRNCIYFADGHEILSVSSFCDMGVYDYGQKTLDVKIFEDDDVHTTFTRLFFFIPSF